MTQNPWRNGYRELMYAGPRVTALLVAAFTDSCYALCGILVPTLSAADLLGFAAGSVVVLAIQSPCHEDLFC